MLALAIKFCYKRLVISSFVITKNYKLSEIITTNIISEYKRLQ